MDKKLILQGLQKAHEIIVQQTPELWEKALWMVRIDSFIKLGLVIVGTIILGFILFISKKALDKDYDGFYEQMFILGGVCFVVGFLISIFFIEIIYPILIQLFLPEYWIVLQIIGK